MQPRHDVIIVSGVAGAFLSVCGQMELRCPGRRLGLIASLVVAAHSLALASDKRDEASSSQAISIDIPALPLAEALEAYSVAVGREVVYNGKLAIGQESAAVHGIYTPEAALQRLLEGSGLSPRYMAADAFVLVPTPTDKPRLPVNTASSADVARYYGLIQAGLRRIFCADSRTQPGNYRVAVSFWIEFDGRVSRTELLGTSGKSDVDARIAWAFRSFSIGVPPPEGFAQPVTLLVTPQAPQTGRDCQMARDRQPSVRGLP